MRPDDLAKNTKTLPLRKIAPFILAFDLVGGLIIWFLRDSLFESSGTATILAAVFIMAGVLTYFILMHITKQK